MMATEYGGAPSWEDWSQPRTLGPYRLLEPLGVNAADTVYLARVDGAHRLQRWVALRVVEGASAGDHGQVRELCVQARRAASIAHPNLMTVFDVAESDGSWWVATEYLLGESAEQL